METFIEKRSDNQNWILELAKTIGFTYNIVVGINSCKLTPIFKHSKLISRDINHCELTSRGTGNGKL